MRIGILTFNCALNYGANLQMFALQEAIRDIDPDVNVEVINYTPAYFDRDIAGTIKKTNNWLLKKLKTFNLRKKRASFEEFHRKYVDLSKEVYDEKSLYKINDIYDIVICGSDQIWNSKITHDDSNYFLPFLSSEKKATYAVSFGSNVLEGDRIQHVEMLIQDYRIVSVRESYSKDQLSENISDSKRIRLDLDPVLLLKQSKWEVFQKKSNVAKYILVFEVSASKELIEKALSIANKMKMEVHCIGPYIRIKGIKYIPSPGFDALFSEFSNATYIFTNSYHGTLLSVVFMKQFYSQCNLNSNNGGRIGDILNRLDLVERCHLDKLDSNIDWDQSNEKLAHLRLHSLEYLRSIIENSGTTIGK